MQIYNAVPKLSESAAALGFFDGLHPGHEAVIRQACAGEHLPVVLTIGSTQRMASRLLTDPDRDILLERMGAHALVIPDFESIKDMTGEGFFKDILVGRLNCKKLVCGQNFRFGRGAACSAADLEAMSRAEGIECVVVPMVEADGAAVSSRRLRTLLDDGNVAQFARIMGRRYSYCLEVVSGQRLGRRLGFPTVNQNMPAYLHLPRFGVYASVVRTPDGVVRSGVTNIGVRPTVGSCQPLSETWIMDYSADIYGQNLRVELVDFIRPEQRFGSLDALRQAIEENAEQAATLTAGITEILLP